MLDAVPFHPFPMFHIAFGTRQKGFQRSKPGSVDNADGSRTPVAGELVAIVVILAGEAGQVGRSQIKLFEHPAI